MKHTRFNIIIILILLFGCRQDGSIHVNINNTATSHEANNVLSSDAMPDIGSPSLALPEGDNNADTEFTAWFSYPDRSLYRPYYNSLAEDESDICKHVFVEQISNEHIIINGEEYVPFFTYRDYSVILPGVSFYRIDLSSFRRVLEMDNGDSLYSNMNATLLLLEHQDGQRMRFIKKIFKDSIILPDSTLYKTVTINGVVFDMPNDFSFILDSIGNHSLTDSMSIDEFTEYTHNDFNQILFLWEYNQIDGLYLGTDIIYLKDRYYMFDPSEKKFYHIGAEWQTTLNPILVSRIFTVL